MKLNTNTLLLLGGAGLGVYWYMYGNPFASKKIVAAPIETVQYEQPIGPAFMNVKGVEEEVDIFGKNSDW